MTVAVWGLLAHTPLEQVATGKELGPNFQA